MTRQLLTRLEKIEARIPPVVVTKPICEIDIAKLVAKLKRDWAFDALAEEAMTPAQLLASLERERDVLESERRGYRSDWEAPARCLMLDQVVKKIALIRLEAQ